LETTVNTLDFYAAGPGTNTQQTLLYATPAEKRREAEKRDETAAELRERGRQYAEIAREKSERASLLGAGLEESMALGGCTYGEIAALDRAYKLRAREYGAAAETAEAFFQTAEAQAAEASRLRWSARYQEATGFMRGIFGRAPAVAAEAK
jgi:hypothetical protein